MAETIKDRLKQLAQAKGYSIRSFEETCGLGRGNISNMSQDGSIGSDKLSKIIDTFQDVDLYWLLTGHGDMLRSSDPVTANPTAIASVPPQFGELIATITQQAEEIGRLKALIAELERHRGDNAPDAQSDNVAHAG